MVQFKAQMSRLPHAAALIVVAATLSITTGVDTAIAGPVGTPGPCPLTRDEGESIRALSRDLIRCAVARWAVPGGPATAICIARRESGLLPWAESADGINKGLFQQHVDFWSSNYERYTKPTWQLWRGILNGRTNAIVSIRMAADIGWGPWGGRRCV